MPFARPTLPSLIGLFLVSPAWAAGDYIHRVESGETLSAIAQKLTQRPASWSKLAALNALANPHRLTPGQQLRIPLNWLRLDAVPARVSVIQGEARRGQGHLEAGSRLSPGEEIITGPDGYVTLELSDGSRLVIQPNSRLRLERMLRARGAALYRTRLELLNGRVDNQTARQLEGGAYQVDTPVATIAVRGTAFRVQAEADLARAEVLEGVVGAGGKHTPGQALHAGEGLVIQPHRAGKSEALLPAPPLPKFPQTWEKTSLSFPLPNQIGAVAYRIELALDRDFSQIVAATRAQGEAKFIEVPDGHIWLRLRALSASGLEGLNSAMSLVVAARPEAPFPSGPADHSVLRDSQIRFQWTASQGAHQYRFQLQDAKGKLLREIPELFGTALNLDLTPGVYRWRVGSIDDHGRLGPWGDLRTVELRALPPTPPPPSLAGDHLALSWRGEAGQVFEVEMAQDQDFKAPILRLQTPTPSLTLALPSPGSYFLRVRATDPDGFVGPWSASQGFEVPTRPWWLLFALLPALL